MMEVYNSRKRLRNWDNQEVIREKGYDGRDEITPISVSCEQNQDTGSVPSIYWKASMFDPKSGRRTAYINKSGILRTISDHLDLLKLWEAAEKEVELDPGF